MMTQMTINVQIVDKILVIHAVLMPNRGKMNPNNDFLDNLANDQHQKMLREIANDGLTPKKTNKRQDSEIFQEYLDSMYSDISNDANDPIILNEFW